MLADYNRVRDWKASLEQGDGYRIEYAEVNHRQFGRQRLPHKLLFDTLEDLLAYLKKTQEFERFKALYQEITTRHPSLVEWVVRYPIKVLELADLWPRLLAVIDFFLAHPRPGRYLRELLIPSVDSKFIERNSGVLWTLLDQALPSGGIDDTVTGQASHGFERRYGLKYDQPLIRFRLLDGEVAQAYGGIDDISLPLEQFRRLDLPLTRVFITENKINGLSFPYLPGSMVIFGLGYGITALKEVEWLRLRQIYYWGDIDTHGFAILSQLRGYFPHVESLLMDLDTLEALSNAWVDENPTKRTTADLPNLDSAEQKCYRLLCENRLGENIRLEQERIPFDRLNTVLLALRSSL